MATESDLRDLLRDPEPEGRPAIDLDAVLTRARRRRRPKVIAAQALGSVAAVGALFVGISAVIPPQQAAMMVAEDSAGGAEEFASEPEQFDSSLRIAEEVCGERFTTTSMPGPWTLEIQPLTTDELSPGENMRELTAPVTLRNDGTTTLTGTAYLPRFVVTLDGVVVGNSPAVERTPESISLAPGAATTFEVAVHPTQCFAVTEPEDIPRVIGEFRTRFSDRDDVLVDLDATPAA